MLQMYDSNVHLFQCELDTMPVPLALVLSRADIARAMPLGDCIAAIEAAFALAADARVDVPAVVHLATPDGGFHVKSAAYVGPPHYAVVKVNGNYPGNPARHGLPTIQGAILLFDTRNGTLLAVMDSGEVTALRTAAATAVAARHLAHPGARTAIVIGCGVQGRVQLLALREVLPIDRVYVCDIDAPRARRFADDLSAETGSEVMAVERFSEVSRGCGVIVTCTPARQAFLAPEHVAPGTFVAAVGADHPGKHEIRPALMAAACVVVDQIDQCAEMGDLHHAIVAGAMPRNGVAAELGAVVAGQVRLDRSPRDITVFDSTGTAVQDVAAAGLVHQRALAAGIGTRIQLA